MHLTTPFTKDAGIEVPVICGAMYPCSNPELIAAVSEAGGIGIVQPLSLVYVHGYDFRKGLQYIKSLTQKPFGMNVIVERSSKVYEKRMREYLQIALEEGCRFFITALGNPLWVVEQVKPFRGIVYHDVVERKWALKAIETGIRGLICVNNRAGGHAGHKSAEMLMDELKDLNVPLICAGGIGNAEDFLKALEMGYAGVQMGTRFIASKECKEKEDYKIAICQAKESDIVLTERVTGIPLSVINTPYVQKIGTKVNPLSRWLLQHRLTKHWMRIWYGLRAIRQFKKITLHGGSSKDYWQAGKSVAHIQHIEPAGAIVKEFKEASLNNQRNTHQEACPPQPKLGLK